MRDNHRRMTAAYHAGRAGQALPADAGEQERQAHQAGLEEAANPVATPPASPRPVGRSSGVASRPRSASRPRGAWVSQGPTGTVRRLGSTITGGPDASVGRTGGGLLLGMVGYCLVINLIRYGTPGVTGWISAKFWNQPMGTTAAKPKSLSPSQAPNPKHFPVPKIPNLPGSNNYGQPGGGQQ